MRGETQLGAAPPRSRQAPLAGRLRERSARFPPRGSGRRWALALLRRGRLLARLLARRGRCGAPGGAGCAAGGAPEPALSRRRRWLRLGSAAAARAPLCRCQPALPAADITARRRSDGGTRAAGPRGVPPPGAALPVPLGESPESGGVAAPPPRRGAAPVPAGAPRPAARARRGGGGGGGRRRCPAGGSPRSSARGPGGPALRPGRGSGAGRSAPRSGWPGSPAPAARPCPQPPGLPACSGGAARGDEGAPSAWPGSGWESARARGGGRRPRLPAPPPAPPPAAPLRGRRPRQCGGCPFRPPPAEPETGTEEPPAEPRSRRGRAAAPRLRGAGRGAPRGDALPGLDVRGRGEGRRPSGAFPGGGCWAPGASERAGAARGRGLGETGDSAGTEARCRAAT